MNQSNYYMTNEIMQALIADLGSKIFCIVCDNNHKVFVGCGATSPDNVVTTDLIQYKSIDGVDFFGIHHVSHTWDGIDVPYTNWILTAYVQGVMATDELGIHLPDLNAIF